MITTNVGSSLFRSLFNLTSFHSRGNVWQAFLNSGTEMTGQLLKPRAEGWMKNVLPLLETQV